MRTGLRVAALAVWVAVVGLWFFGGMNLGWTKTSVPVEHRDEVTDQTYQVWETRFLPGLEFLAGGLSLGLAVYAGSFLARKK